MGGCLKENESRIKEREALDQAEEKERIAKVDAERKRKAKSDRALARNNARLRGDEDVPDTDEEEAAIAAAEAEAAAAAAAANAASADDVASVRSGPPSRAPSRKPSHASVSAVTGPPPASRGGTKLTPLHDPPQPSVGANQSP